MRRDDYRRDNLPLRFKKMRQVWSRKAPDLRPFTDEDDHIDRVLMELIYLHKMTGNAAIDAALDLWDLWEREHCVPDGWDLNALVSLAHTIQERMLPWWDDDRQEAAYLSRALRDIGTRAGAYELWDLRTIGITWEGMRKRIMRIRSQRLHLEEAHDIYERVLQMEEGDEILIDGSQPGLVRLVEEIWRESDPEMRLIFRPIMAISKLIGPG